MAFIQSCFIRKNTHELRKKLDELGYKFSGADHIELDCIVTFPHNDTFSVFAAYHFNIYDDNFKTVWKGYIDCGTNEELFLALAALRDDTDKYQQFVCIESYCDYFDLFHDIGYFTKCITDRIPDSKYWRKATLQELIEHFKK